MPQAYLAIHYGGNLTAPVVTVATAMNRKLQDTSSTSSTRKAMMYEDNQGGHPLHDTYFGYKDATSEGSMRNRATNSNNLTKLSHCKQTTYNE